jgi:predicted ester cyclase
MVDEYSERIEEIVRAMPPAERKVLARQLQSNGRTALEPTNGGGVLAEYKDAALVRRYIQDIASVDTRDNASATLPLRVGNRVIELLRSALEASGDASTFEHLSEQEQRRQEYVALTARYVKEQQARNYVLPEDTTAMTTPQKDHLFDQIVAGRVAITDEERRVENVAIFYRYIELENGRDYENMKKLFHPTQFCSKTYFGNDPISPEAHVRMLRGLFRAFPDWYMVIYEIIASDPIAVVGLITGRGTQHEEFFGRPPADHQIAIPTLHSIKVRKGLIVEHRHINPFENIFANQIMAPLTEDIMAVRAQQGFDSSLSQKAYDLAVAAGASEEKLNELREIVRAKARQCQVLLKGTLRRCAMIAEPGEIYCAHHRGHGYGIDGIEPTERM